ncbi:MAG: hypothetical protein ABI678_06745, partial [Kofleriaceae bacterium]
MAKKQTRRSISVSRTTYERLKAFCETNNISMSQFVETRVGDFLGEGSVTVIPTTPAPRPPIAPTPTRPLSPMSQPTGIKSESRPVQPAPVSHPAPQQVPMTSAAARFAVEPPPPVIKQKQQETAPKPTE